MGKISSSMNLSISSFLFLSLSSSFILLISFCLAIENRNRQLFFCSSLSFSLQSRWSEHEIFEGAKNWDSFKSGNFFFNAIIKCYLKNTDIGRLLEMRSKCVFTCPLKIYRTNRNSLTHTNTQEKTKWMRAKSSDDLASPQLFLLLCFRFHDWMDSNNACICVKYEEFSSFIELSKCNSVCWDWDWEPTK